MLCKKWFCSYNLRSCTLPHLYSPGVNAVFAAHFRTKDCTVPSNRCNVVGSMVGSASEEHVAMLERVPRLIRPAEDWSVLVSGDGDAEQVSRYNELERKRAAREHGPIKSVRRLSLEIPTILPKTLHLFIGTVLSSVLMLTAKTAFTPGEYK